MRGPTALVAIRCRSCQTLQPVRIATRKGCARNKDCIALFWFDGNAHRQRTNIEIASGAHAGGQRLSNVNGDVDLAAAVGSEQLAPVACLHKPGCEFVRGNFAAIGGAQPALDERFIAVELHAHEAGGTRLAVEVRPPEMLEQGSQAQASKPRINEL